MNIDFAIDYIRALEMKNIVVSFSGGRTSGYMVYLFEEIRKVADINVEYVFADTGAEHPKTYEFIRTLSASFQVDITCLRVAVNMERGIGVSYQVVDLNDCKHDLKPFTEFMQKYSTPTIMGAKCTDRMKSTPSDKYCNEKYGRRNYIKFLGMRVDEQNRIKSVDAQIDMFKETTKKQAPILLDYLGNISDFTKEDVLEWWRGQEFDLQIQEHLGNCVFCIKKGANKLALAAHEEPDLAQAFIKMVNLDSIPLKPCEPKIANDIMYRNHQSLESIIESYKDVDKSHLEREVRLGKRNASGSCSESCEATFSLDLN